MQIFDILQVNRLWVGGSIPEGRFHRGCGGGALFLGDRFHGEGFFSGWLQISTGGKFPGWGWGGRRGSDFDRHFSAWVGWGGGHRFRGALFRGGADFRGRGV